MAELKPVPDRVPASIDEMIRLAAERLPGHALVLLTPDGRIVGWNEGAERLFDRSRTSVVGSSLASVFGHVPRPGQSTEEQLLQAKALLEIESAGRRDAEAARTRLLRRLVAAQEEERRRLARELHDDLGQRLTTLRLTLETLKPDYPRADGQSAIGNALGMLATIDRAIDFLAWGLRPAALDELGLVNVLQAYIQEWSRHTDVSANFHSEFQDAERFGPEIETTLYRITQEALNNVAKHARATNVNVLLGLRESAVTLAVEDNGCGLLVDPECPTALGISVMRERAAAVGGIVEIEPTAGGGTTILVRVPLAATTPVAHPLPQGALSDSQPQPPYAMPHDASPIVDSLRGRLKELQLAVAARDEFVATVAHELRNPVAPLTFQVRLAVERIQQNAATTPVSGEWALSQFLRIEQRLHRLLDTLERLLDVSRLSTGRIDLQPEAMDLGTAVRDVVGALESEIAMARCEVTVSEQGQLTGVWDRLRIEQILRNLLVNAIQYGAGRPIEVRLHGDEAYANIQIRDHGIGIPKPQQARIFERFERVTGQRSGGFGIGLWVVRSLCLAMGGNVTVDSEVGDGATFTIALPRGGDLLATTFSGGGRAGER